MTGRRVAEKPTGPPFFAARRPSVLCAALRNSRFSFGSIALQPAGPPISYPNFTSCDNQKDDTFNPCVSTFSHVNFRQQNIPCLKSNWHYWNNPDNQTEININLLQNYRGDFHYVHNSRAWVSEEGARGRWPLPGFWKFQQRRFFYRSDYGYA